GARGGRDRGGASGAPQRCRGSCRHRHSCVRWATGGGGRRGAGRPGGREDVNRGRNPTARRAWRPGQAAAGGRRPGGRGGDPAELAGRAAEAEMIDELDLAFDEHAERGRPRHRRGGRGGKKGSGKTGVAFLMAFILLAVLGGGVFLGYNKVKGFFTAADYDGPGSVP